MIAPEYALQQMRALMRMAFGGDDAGGDVRRDGASQLDCTIDGVFKSFWAIVLSAPLSILIFLAARRAVLQSPQAGETALAQAPIALLASAEMVGLAGVCLASIAALGMVARAMGASRQIALLIVGFNWSQLISALFLSAGAIAFALTKSANLFALLYLPAAFLYLALLWGVIRKSLPVNVGMTIALIVMLIIIELFVNMTVSTVFIHFYRLFS